MAMVTLLFESSTVFMHARLSLIEAKATAGPLFAVAQFGFVGAFFLSRIAHGLWACGKWWLAMDASVAAGAVAAERVPVVRMYQALCGLLSGLNVYWFALIVLAAVTVSKKPKAS
jgi:hypothetical protein